MTESLSVSKPRAPSPLDAPMKRTSARKMFDLAADYTQAVSPGDDSGNWSATSPGPQFAILPRFNVCLRLHPDAVRLYFNHVHPRRNWRTSLVQRILSLAASLPSAARGQLLRLLSDTALHQPHIRHPRTDWNKVDILLAEWQFVALISGSEQTVSHILTDDKYARCLENEIDARHELSDFVPIPAALHVEHAGSVRGWTEPFIPNDVIGTQRRDAFSEIQALLCVSYFATGDEVEVDTYLRKLEKLTEQLYPVDSSTEVGSRLRRLTEWARQQAMSEHITSVPVARVHGDLNLGQVLSADGQRRLIDWSESEIGIAFHDYVYSALWHYGWRTLDAPIDISDLSVMRDGLEEITQRVSPLLSVVLVLIEVGLKQHGDYLASRGTIRTWLELTDHALRLCTSEPSISKA